MKRKVNTNRTSGSSCRYNFTDEQIQMKMEEEKKQDKEQTNSFKKESSNNEDDTDSFGLDFFLQPLILL
jgi:hypothetical protein